MKPHKSRVVLSVTNDLATDQRVEKVCNSLLQMGFFVTLIGRKLPWSTPLTPKRHTCIRMKLFFRKGPLFYAEYNIRLFFKLLITKFEIAVANDLDTLLAAWLASKIKGAELIYDSHEFYTETPELINRPRVRNVWLWIERIIFPTLKDVITVNNSIAEAYFQRYHIPVQVVKNLPLFQPPAPRLTMAELNLPSSLPFVILQGAGINIDRGAEELIQAMAYVTQAQLIIVGSGDVFPLLRKKKEELGLHHNVTIIDRVPYDQLRRITASAIVGATLDKDTNPNYRFSLPNKLFDYIQSGIPVLASRLPEIEKVLNQYQIGSFIDSHDPKHIAERIDEMITNVARYQQWRQNCLDAAKVLCWENQEHTLREIYGKFIR